MRENQKATALRISQKYTDFLAHQSFSKATTGKTITIFYEGLTFICGKTSKVHITNLRHT